MKQNLHLLKVGISQHSYYICQFPAIFRLMWAFAFFSILYPEKNIRFPHSHPTTSRSGQFWTYQVDQLLETIRLGSPSTPVGIMGCDLYTCQGTHV